jgi:hypothetical protein
MYIPLLQSCDSAADVVYNTAELVSENIALLKLDNGAVKQMQIRTANCGSGDLDNDIAGLENGGLPIHARAFIFSPDLSAHAGLLAGLVTSCAVVALSA